MSLLSHHTSCTMCIHACSKGRKWHAFIIFHVSGIFTALSAQSHENTRFIHIYLSPESKIPKCLWPVLSGLLWFTGCRRFISGERAERRKVERKIETLSCPTAASRRVARKRKEQRFKGERASASCCKAHCEGRPFRWHQTIHYTETMQYSTVTNHIRCM